eukprot:CAMPEP_0197844774 /NCGR_PEP_ID=MMETSP1438-20131217/1760_1 /TAXON_ID=1461541 /ORGANISM="Pterosperma sp., Strain CCMP1384" /LENGTH=54 /DNA_ID=CAMNT_0043455743 /DNA_START=242 /DNA_END=406 /DNA_ORIENTATION=-
MVTEAVMNECKGRKLSLASQQVADANGELSNPTTALSIDFEVEFHIEVASGAVD